MRRQRRNENGTASLKNATVCHLPTGSSSIQAAETERILPLLLELENQNQHLTIGPGVIGYKGPPCDAAEKMRNRQPNKKVDERLSDGNHQENNPPLLSKKTFRFKLHAFVNVSKKWHGGWKQPVNGLGC